MRDVSKEFLRGERRRGKEFHAERVQLTLTDRTGLGFPASFNRMDPTCELPLLPIDLEMYVL